MPQKTTPSSPALPATLGELRTSKEFTEAAVCRSVKDELRANLIRRLQDQASAKVAEPIFPGIVGYDDTVIPQIVNAILSRQNFILLGLRGQAKSRILRALTQLLDDQLPYVAGCEDPRQPLSADLRSAAASSSPNAATPRPSPGSRATSATSKSSLRPTSPSPT